MTQQIYDLSRFQRAQQNSYDAALREIRAGLKTTHWIWYIFPQLKGLGKSHFSEFYGISGRAEAEAYMADPVLRGRLLEICDALLQHTDKSAVDILGSIDARKLCSCATLFREAAPDCAVFDRILAQFFGGRPDYRTLGMLESESRRTT